MLNQLRLLLYTKFFGKRVGIDSFNNSYYCTRNISSEKRWVIYNGVYDPSKIPANWYGWLHFLINTPPSFTSTNWIPNTTGTTFAQKYITSIENIPQSALKYYNGWSPQIDKEKDAKKLH